MNKSAPHISLLGAQPPIEVAEPPYTTPTMSLYFDLETTGVGPAGKITCAATSTADATTTWHSGFGNPLAAADGQRLADALVAAPEVYTFNGAAFDLRKLHELTGDDRLRDVALRHRDLMLDFVADRRFYTSMESLASPTLGTGKSNTGAWAATAWFTGEAAAVLEYCAQDTVVLRDLCDHAERWGKLTRRSKAGKLSEWVLPSLDGSIRGVAAAKADQMPPPAWMSSAPLPMPDLRWAGL